MAKGKKHAPATPLPAGPPAPLTIQQRRERARKHAEAQADARRDKLLAGPDPTQARLANSPYPESALMALHYGIGSGRVDRDGTPSMRVAMVRNLDNALLDSEEGAQRDARLEALRTSPKRSHRRAYMLLIASFGGMTQKEIALIAGEGGKRITQARVSQILTAAKRLLQSQ